MCLFENQIKKRARKRRVEIQTGGAWEMKFDIHNPEHRKIVLKRLEIELEKIAKENEVKKEVRK
jgi:hypothetical protein